MLRFSKNKIQRICRNIIIVVLVVFVVSMATTKVVYDSIFRRYDGVTASLPNKLVAVSKDYDIKTKESTLHGQFFKSENNQVLVVIVPGFHAQITDYAPQVSNFLSNGMSVFAFDATGSGKSEGDSHIGFSQIVIDLENVLEFLKLNKNFGCKDIVLFGHSRGGYAVCCALKDNKDIDAVVSVSGANSAMDAVTVSSKKHVGFLAYTGYPFLWLYQSAVFGAEVVDTTAAECVNESNVPTLIIHGTKDTEVPLDDGSVISHKEEILCGDVYYYEMNNGHNDILKDKNGNANEKLMTAVNEFLKKVLGESDN